MRPEGGVRQRGLVDRRIVFSDEELAVSYVFPFVDRRWRVPFVVVALSMGAPLVLDGPFRVDQFRFRTALRTNDLRRIESIPLEDLEQLVHYDPWWVFRRVSGVGRTWIEAVFATNIAAPFRHGGRTHKVRDLFFSAELDRLEEIESPRCPQMTPAVDACNLACQFCWRTQEWGSNSLLAADDPAFIVDESIRGQRELLTGFKGNPNVSRERFLEAWHPTNVAISLTGEPTLYKRLGEMIDEFKRRKMSTFLVTNGTTPAVLRRMHSEGRLPTQLYVTVAAPNAEIYRKLVAAKSDHEWNKLRETLALLPTLPTRTVVRHTLVEGWNLGWEDEYAELDRLGKPMFIECKGYSFVGESRLRLQAENVPSHASIRTFAERLADRLGYRIAAEREDSRVVLLTQDGALHPIFQ